MHLRMPGTRGLRAHLRAQRSAGHWAAVVKSADAVLIRHLLRAEAKRHAGWPGKVGIPLDKRRGGELGCGLRCVERERPAVQLLGGVGRAVGRRGRAVLTTGRASLDNLLADLAFFLLPDTLMEAACALTDSSSVVAAAAVAAVAAVAAAVGGCSVDHVGTKVSFPLAERGPWHAHTHKNSSIVNSQPKPCIRAPMPSLPGCWGWGCPKGPRSCV